jgi:hypothetical protein
MIPGMPNALKPRVQFVKSGRPVTAASIPVATKLAPNGAAAVAPPKPLPPPRMIRSISPFGPSLGGMEGVDGVFDFVKDLVPSHTVVGKLIGGDVKGAAQGAVKEGQRLLGRSGGNTTAGPVYYDGGAPAPQGSGFAINKPLLFASLGLGAIGVLLLVRSRR